VAEARAVVEVGAVAMVEEWKVVVEKETVVEAKVVEGMAEGEKVGAEEGAVAMAMVGKEEVGRGEGELVAGGRVTEVAEKEGESMEVWVKAEVEQEVVELEVEKEG
jgi:hypothetical protein